MKAIPQLKTAAPAVSRSVTDIHRHVAAFRKQPDAVVGLVPTMGCLHEGHLSLMRVARSECDAVVVSIFVNPAQFGPGEDLDSYPRDLERDLSLAAAETPDVVFAPPAAEIYPDGYDTTIDAGQVAAGLCGLSRPGHFKGVATVVAKLFNIVSPDIAYFGQKDAQQVAVIRQMARDLDFGVQIRACPTVREKDGLALSSRNMYLSSEERSQAAALYEALTLAREAAARGETDAGEIKKIMRKTISSRPLVDIEYVEVVDRDTMQPVGEIRHEALAAVAARVGRARLVDNMILSSREEQCGE